MALTMRRHDEADDGNSSEHMLAMMEQMASRLHMQNRSGQTPAAKHQDCGDCVRGGGDL